MICSELLPGSPFDGQQAFFPFVAYGVRGAIIPPPSAPTSPEPILRADWRLIVELVVRSCAKDAGRWAGKLVLSPSFVNHSIQQV